MNESYKAILEFLIKQCIVGKTIVSPCISLIFNFVQKTLQITTSVRLCVHRGVFKHGVSFIESSLLLEVMKATSAPSDLFLILIVIIWLDDKGNVLRITFVRLEDLL